MQSSGEGIVYLEIANAPAAGVGDDILAMADVVHHRDGRLIAKSVGLDPRYAAALRRLKAGTDGGGPDSEWKVLSGIVAAERNGDVRVGVDASAVSVIRPFAATPKKEMLARHVGQGPVARDAPRYVLDPIVYAAPGRNQDRRKDALPAGLVPARTDPSGPTMTPSFGPDGETRAWLMYFGEAENCSYTKLARISGRGMLPRHDISSSLADEFFTIHEYAHTLDDEMDGLESGKSPHELRRMEAFADAFAVTELVMAGRNPEEIAMIVSCREAAIVGLSFGPAGRNANIGGIEHLSGAAARAALAQAAAARKAGRRANSGEILRQARKISEQFTIGDIGMKTLQQSLKRLGDEASPDDLRRWLATLEQETKDPVLKANAASLRKQLDMFFLPSQQKAAAGEIAKIHAISLDRHQEHVRESGLAPGVSGLLADREAAAWSIRNEGFITRTIRKMVPGSANGLDSRIAANLSKVAAAATPTPEHSGPALSKVPVQTSGIPNPWTFSVTGRLQQCAKYAMEAYRVIAAVELHGIPSQQQQDTYVNAMRGLTAFVESVTLRDPTKDGKAVRKRFDERPELEDYLRMVGTYRYSDMKLPADEGRRLQLQAVILAIDPQADLPEMPRKASPESQIPEFGADIFPAGERE